MPNPNFIILCCVRFLSSVKKMTAIKVRENINLWYKSFRDFLPRSEDKADVKKEKVQLRTRVGHVVYFSQIQLIIIINNNNKARKEKRGGPRPFTKSPRLNRSPCFSPISHRSHYYV